MWIRVRVGDRSRVSVRAGVRVGDREILDRLRLRLGLWFGLVGLGLGLYVVWDRD